MYDRRPIRELNELMTLFLQQTKHNQPKQQFPLLVFYVDNFTALVYFLLFVKKFMAKKCFVVTNLSVIIPYVTFGGKLSLNSPKDSVREILNVH